MADETLEQVLSDGLVARHNMSAQALIKAIMEGIASHGGHSPSHVLASPSQVQRWADEVLINQRERGEDWWRPKSFQIMGVRVLPVAGPTRLIWSEEVKS